MRGIPALVYICFFAVSILIALYILCDIRQFSRASLKKRIKWLYLAFATAGIIPLLISLFIPTTGEQPLTILMWLIYAYISFFLPQLLYVIISLIGRLIAFISHASGNKFGVGTGLLFAIFVFFSMLWGTLMTRHEIEVEHVSISSPRLPKSFDGYKIIQFSDMHVGTWGKDTSFVAQFVKEINSLNPDLIVFTGDLVNRETIEMEPFLSILSKLKALDGVYSVMGNHDYGDYNHWKSQAEHDANNDLMRIWQRQIGWRLLDNEHRWISNSKDSIALIGVENWGEPPFHQYGRLTDAYPIRRDSKINLNDNNFKILLSHNPEHWNREVSKISNIDLTLSGHTHAMQLMMRAFGKKWSPSAWRYPQWGGMYERQSPEDTPSRLYVNIGAGEVGIPARFGSAYPEITLITLHHDNSRKE